MDKLILESWKKPNDSIVKSFAEAFDICFCKDEEELKRLFCDSNVQNDEVLNNRVRRLNALYHTHLWGKITEEIVTFLKAGGAKFEKEIKSGDICAVKKLAKRERRNCFVFATKYCSFVAPDKYPIYDSLVVKALLYFHTQKPLVEGRLSFERIRKTYDYATFKEIVDEFKKQYYLEKCSYKEIDQFLWLVGKNLL
ncbi:MAG: hypothetical protein K5669_00055 [Lachnospiraceae bacterium]|nr:hypothetical protein [Lachnospiraceae bacterium]